MAKRCSTSSPAAVAWSSKSLDGVPAVGSESDHDEAVGTQVRRQSAENSLLAVRSQERHDIACHHDRVEQVRIARGRKIQLAEVTHEPHRPQVVLVCGRDQLGVDVHAHDGVSSRVEFRADASGSTACIENARSGSNHRIDEGALPGQVRALRRHVAEALDVPLG